MSAQIMRAGEHGPLFKLRAPHTVASLRDDATRAEEGRPWRCRRGWHRREVVGDVHIPDDLYPAVFALIASSDVSALTRCKRCGAVQVKGR